MSSVALRRRENDAHAAQLFGPPVPPAAAILESPAWGSRVRCLAKATYGLPATKAQGGDASESKPTSTALILGDGRSKRPRDADPGVGAVESRGIVAVSTEKLRAEAEQAASAEDRAAADAQRYPQWGLKRMTVAHKGRVTSLAVDPSNMWYASGSADSVIKAWDLASGKLRANLTGHTAAVRGLAMSELSPYMFSCGEDKQVKCWDLETNRIVRDFFGHLSAVYTVAAHPRQDIIVTGGRDATVRVWDVRSRSCVHVMQGHSESVFTVQAQDAEPQVVSGAADGMVYLWDIASGRPITRLTRHKKSVRGAVLHPAEATMATCGADGVRKWRLPHGEYMGKATSLPDAPDGLWSCAALSARDVLFVGADDGGYMRFYDWGSSTMFQHRPCKSVKGTLPGEGGVLCCAFDRSGQRLLTGEGDKTVKVWAEKPKAEHDDQPRAEATASFAAPMT